MKPFSIADFYNKNDPFHAVRGQYKGQPGFVAASGPSLRSIPQDAFKGKPVIAVNSAIVKFPSAPFFFSSDWRVIWRKHWQTVRWANCDIVMATQNIQCVDWWGGVYRPQYRYLLYAFADSTHETLLMDPSAKNLIYGHSSIQCAVHFAAILGCSPIILLGNDCQVEDGKKYFYEFPGQPEDAWLLPWMEARARQYEKEENGEKLTTDLALEVSLKHWAKLADANPQMTILNGTGGRLKVFPSVDWRKYL